MTIKEDRRTVTRLEGLSTQRPRWTPAPSLSEAGGGGDFLRRGAEGESVRELQSMLVDRGLPIQVDGKFGPETARAVRAFQQREGIQVDGIVGPETLGRLQGSQPQGSQPQGSQPQAEQPFRREGPASAPPVTNPRAPRPEGTLSAGELARTDEQRRMSRPGAVTLAPANASPEERYQHYAAIVRANGGEVNPNGQPTVLGLRGLSRANGGVPRDTGSTRAYDDTFVVLRPDGRAYEMRGATHPGQNRSSLSPDVNGDGRGDVGMIHPGNYNARPSGNHNGASAWHVTTTSGSGRIPGVRDTNGDGVFSEAERAASARRGDGLTEILFHQGFDNSPKSIGCLTMSPAVYREFIQHLGGSRNGFNFSLVDAYRR